MYKRDQNYIMSAREAVQMASRDELDIKWILD